MIENQNKTKDQVIRVNSQDQVIGELDKYEAHRYPSQLHRAVSVWLLNNRGEVLFQKRSEYKILGAGWWANTICGNVRPNEHYEACAKRRLREELGITNVKIVPLYTFEYQIYGNETYGEHEMDRVFVGHYNGEVAPNPLEVSAFKWISLTELLKNTKDLSWPTPAETLLKDQASLVNLTNYELQMNGEKNIIAPWTILMSKDKRLRKKFSNFE